MLEPTSKKTAEQILKEIKDHMLSKSCGDHGCIYGHRGGMGTNGGCAHMSHEKYESRRQLRELAWFIRGKLKELDVPTQK